MAKFKAGEGWITRDPVDGAPIMPIDHFADFMDINCPDPALSLNVMQDSAGVRFIVHNKGVTDDGKHLEVDVICRIQPDDGREL